LLSVFAASNELPEEGELVALFDRFLLRFEVDYIADDADFLRLLRLSDDGREAATLGLDQLHKLQEQARQVSVPTSVLRDLVALRAQLNDAGIEASDRRYRKSLNVLRAFALLSGRDRVAPGDLALLEHMLWTDPSDRGKVSDAIRTIAQRFEEETHSLLEKAQEQQHYATRYWPTQEQKMSASVEALAKLKSLLARADLLIEEAGDRDDGSLEAAQTARATIESAMASLLHGVDVSRH
ncbi:MAG: hypothetical protein KC561_19550, partial [Myxococcales bacterium]|nr:hypothetical protein [Myxococcales bacterium]